MSLTDYLERHEDAPELEQVLEFFPQLPGRLIDDGKTFRFKWVIGLAGPYSSFWFLQFYEYQTFIGFTAESEATFQEAMADLDKLPDPPN
jgi:hypothetical protein